MHTITVDDEQPAVNSLLRLLRQVDPCGQHAGMVHTDQFLDYINTHDVDIAFIDVDLYDTDGLSLTKKLARPILS